jgi:hypothetical protein
MAERPAGARAVRTIDLGPGTATFHEGDPARSLIVLPGLVYFSQAPLLWFAREVAQAQGWSVLELSERAPADQEPTTWICDRAARALDAGGTGMVAVVGKSLASVAAPLVVERQLPAVWLTPLLTRPDVVQALSMATAPTLVVGGTADSSWTDGELPTAGDALEVLEIDGVDHSLQVPGQPLRSLDLLKQVTERLGAFLERLA